MKDKTKELNLKNFTKRVEDFVCENCGTEVIGNGFTDHCTNCLYSKHVDVNPGDRLEECDALMAPVAVKVKTSIYIIYYRCTKCGKKRRVRSAPNDNFDEILKYVSRPIID